MPHGASAKTHRHIERGAWVSFAIMFSSHLQIEAEQIASASPKCVRNRRLRTLTNSLLALLKSLFSEIFSLLI